MAIYPRIRDLREDHDWTQQQVAELLFVARSSYGAYETGISEFTPDLLCQLAELYGTSVDYLLGLTDEMRPYPRSKRR